MSNRICLFLISLCLLLFGSLLSHSGALAEDSFARDTSPAYSSSPVPKPKQEPNSKMVGGQLQQWPGQKPPAEKPTAENSEAPPAEPSNWTVQQTEKLKDGRNSYSCWDSYRKKYVDCGLLKDEHYSKRQKYRRDCWDFRKEPSEECKQLFRTPAKR